MFLGVDGGGTKTTFLLLGADGRIRARAEGGTCYHPAIGLDGVREVLRRGTQDVLAAAGLPAGAIRRAFFGLPAYGEDPAVDPELALAPGAALDPGQYRVGNDMLCGWAGALACGDGISVTAGTGSIAYGEYQGRTARCGGWGEVFGDEGSAHWIGREGLAAFSRMSDGRGPPGPLLQRIRQHFGLAHDLDLAGRINRDSASARSEVAGVSRIVAAAAAAGDATARRIFVGAGHELAALVHATRAQLAVPAGDVLAVSSPSAAAAATIRDTPATSLRADALSLLILPARSRS